MRDGTGEQTGFSAEHLAQSWMSDSECMGPLFREPTRAVRGNMGWSQQMGSEQGHDRRFCDRKAAVPNHPYGSNVDSRWGTSITNPFNSSPLNWGPRREGFLPLYEYETNKNQGFVLSSLSYMSCFINIKLMVDSLRWL